MISRLIDMDIKVINPEPVKSKVITKNSNYNILDYASSFIFGMSDRQREKFKQMLQNNIQCGMSVADSYGIDYDLFITEVKRQLNIE